MLATDVAARGLDIKGIENVIHYEVPRQTELYVHRSGRTARLSADGLSVIIVGPQDVVHYRNIIRSLNKGGLLLVHNTEVTHNRRGPATVSC